MSDLHTVSGYLDGGLAGGNLVPLSGIRGERVFYCNNGHRGVTELRGGSDAAATCPECGTPMRAVGSFSTATI